MHLPLSKLRMGYLERDTKLFGHAERRVLSRDFQQQNDQAAERNTKLFLAGNELRTTAYCGCVNKSKYGNIEKG